MVQHVTVAERPEARSRHKVVGQRVGEGRACHGRDGGLACGDGVVKSGGIARDDKCETSGRSRPEQQRTHAAARQRAAPKPQFLGLVVSSK